MARYEISNQTSGVILGVFEADSEAQALDAMARDAGYSDYRDLLRQIDQETSDDLIIERLAP